MGTRVAMIETGRPAAILGPHNRPLTPKSGMFGIGLRGPHMREILEIKARVDWVEVHPENYFFCERRALVTLDHICRDFPLGLHGVGLSLGSADGVSDVHLGRLSALIERFDPFLVSEHLAWNTVDGIYLNDLLPLPYTEESLALVIDNVAITQDRLGRTILVENPATYLRYRHSTIPETEFLCELARRTGCGILCDVNNLYVSCANHNLDPSAYLSSISEQAVGEIHLAGHSRHEFSERTILIDDHGSRVSPPVMQLFLEAVARFGQKPTLVEWDREIPPLSVLVDEAERAKVSAQCASRATR